MKRVKVDESEDNTKSGRYEVLQEILVRVSTTKSISDSDMLLLSGLFGENVLCVALEAVAKKHVVCVVCKSSNRKAFFFKAHGVQTWVTLHPVSYCSCDTFAQALRFEDNPVCKHLLAVSLSYSMGSFGTESTSDFIKMFDFLI